VFAVASSKLRPEKVLYALTALASAYAHPGLFLYRQLLAAERVQALRSKRAPPDHLAFA